MTRPRCGTTSCCSSGSGTGQVRRMHPTTNGETRPPQHQISSSSEGGEEGGTGLFRVTKMMPSYSSITLNTR